MGTELDYAINLLATSSNSSSFNVLSVDDWDYQRIGMDKFHSSMDRMLERHNIESIKKTMQMHEVIFKHQVQELHRLFHVQRVLMDEVTKEINHNQVWNPMSSSGIIHSQFTNVDHSTTQTTCGHINFRIRHLRDDPSTRERSGSSFGDNMRMTRGFDLEIPALEGVLTGVSAIDEYQAGPNSLMQFTSSKMGTDASNDVELTLSIGGCLSKKQSKNYQPHHSQKLGCLDTEEARELVSSASLKTDKRRGLQWP
ncbi:hypothetical protein CFOL_v3_19491 [Cephalotus follicularis]|uniref:Uncharacterized protein n=1 Tax=Cephalotus follicularis TaxID=3775 RepID=A0A1Q3C6V0_CEPFO|nr:hypothetical protein CFOL_v3_19491 [Cephalotus follicularis]